jgi:hypothetical protein
MNDTIIGYETTRDSNSCNEENRDYLEKLIISTKQNIFNIETDINKNIAIINEHNKKCRRILLGKPKNNNELILKSLRHIFDWYRND